MVLEPQEARWRADELTRFIVALLTVCPWKERVCQEAELREAQFGMGNRGRWNGIAKVPEKWRGQRKQQDLDFHHPDGKI